MTEKVGIEAVFATKEFQKGLNQYLKGLDKAVGSAEKTSSGLNAATQKGSSSMASMGVSAIALGNILATAVTAGIGLVIRAITSLISKVGEAITAFASWGLEAIKTAGRVEELAIVAIVIGRNAGKSRKEIEDATQAIVDQGIQTDVASKAVIAFTRFNLDMSKSSELARVAQDAAVISMSDSSTALDNMILGIQRLQPRILRTVGINVTAADAFEKFAEANNLTAESLTQTQKQAAFLNAVLEQGVNIAGAYEAAMLSPAKRLRSLTRLLFELKSEAGGPFQDAFLQAVMIMEDFVKMLRSAVTEGGIFFTVLMKIGAIASIVLEDVRTFMNGAAQAVEGMAPRVIDTFTDLVFRAFKWGVNIATEFASGIIQGAGSALISAMNFISRLLTSWLAPGSPPKILPNLDTWGALAFGEYLKGMTEASLAPLKELQAILAGEIGDKSFLQLSLDLVKATKELTKAEDDLDNSRKSRIAGQKQLSKLIAKQNKLIRSGASTAALKTNLAAIDAQEAKINASALEEQVMEDKIDTSRDEVKVIKSQISIIRDLISQTHKLMIAQQQTGTGAGEGDGLDLGVIPLPTLPPLEQTLNQVFEDIKATMREKWAEIWAPVRIAYEEDVLPVIEDFKDAWKELTETIQTFWDEKVKPVIEDFKEIIPEGLSGKLTKSFGEFLLVLGVVLLLAVALGALFLILKFVIIPVLALWGAWELLKIALEATVILWRDKIIPGLKSWKTNLENVKKILSTLITKFVTKFFTMLNTGKTKLDGFKNALRGISTWLRNVGRDIVNFAASLLGLKLPAWMNPGSPTPWEMGLRGISKAMKQLSTIDVPALSVSLDRNLVPVPQGNAGGTTSNVVNNNQVSNQEVNITNPQQSNQSIADDLIFANAVAG